MKYFPFKIASAFCMLTILWFVACAPIPMIQSARVTGKSGLGWSYISNSHSVEVLEKDTLGYDMDSTGSRTQIVPIGEYMKNNFFLRFGINDRVELTVITIPNLIPLGLLLGGNMKISLFDLGSEQLFQNISMAIFAGGDYMPMEWDQYMNYWGGLITGTHCAINNTDLEFVFMTSGSSYYFRNYLSGLEIKELSFLTANASLGCIIRPFKYKFLEMNTGVTFRKNFRKQYSNTNERDIVSSDILKYNVNPVIFQCGMQLYIPRKK